MYQVCKPVIADKKYKNWKPFLLSSIFSVLTDQISKILVTNSLSPFDQPREVIGSLLRFKLAYNPYGVFSLSFGPNFLHYIFTIIGILVFTYIGLSQKTKMKGVLFGLIVGGAIGNLIDRIRLKYVIDFIDMGIGDLRWFTYNLADAFVTVSAIYLIAEEILRKK